MRVPQWLSLLVAIWVMAFGGYRLWLARDPKTDQKKAEGKKGLFAMNRRTHLLIGLVYLLLGGALVATSFGWNPMAGLFAPDTSTVPGDAPAKTKTKGGLEVN
jgi:uncharacterized iron-regulated membrane protein